jgi:hypothetical protein
MNIGITRNEKENTMPILQIIASSFMAMLTFILPLLAWS